MTNKPQRKPAHDLSVRLGKDKQMKTKLQKIAGKNDLSMNKLLIFILAGFLYDYEAGKKFKKELK